MTAAPFQPLGEVSRRDMIIAIFANAEDGTIISYENLEELLGLDRLSMQGVVNQAKLALERDHNKALEAVRTVGYRIVLANEHLTLAELHQRKSIRQLRRGKSKVVNVDFDKLTDGERAAITLAATAIGMQLDHARRIEIRAARNEEAIRRVGSAAEKSAAEIAQIEERLARLEARRTDNEDIADG